MLIVLLLSYAISVKVLITMTTSDGVEKYLNHDLKLVKHPTKGATTLWNMDKKGPLYRFRTYKRYMYVNDKNKIIMKNGGEEFKKISNDEKVQLMQSIINNDMEESSSASNMSSMDSEDSEEGSSDGESSNSSRRNKSKADKDREERRKKLGRDKSTHTEDSNKRAKDKRNESTKSEDKSKNTNDKKNEGTNDDEELEEDDEDKKSKGAYSDPIVPKEELMLQPKKRTSKLKSKLLNSETKELQAESKRNDKKKTKRKEVGNDEESDEGEASNDSTTVDEKNKEDEKLKKHKTNNASNLLGSLDTMPNTFTDSFYNSMSFNPFSYNGANNLYLTSTDGADGNNRITERDDKEGDRKSENKDDDGSNVDEEIKTEDKPDKENKNTGFKAGAKKFISNLVGTVKSSSTLGESKKSNLTEERNVKKGAGFYFELIPIFKNKVDHGILIRYKNKCYTHDLKLEKCEYEEYWDLDSKYFWAIYHTTDNHYINTLKAYIEKSEARKRNMNAFECLKVPKCPEVVVYEPKITTCCSSEFKEKNKKKKSSTQCLKNNVNQGQAPLLFNSLQGLPTPMQKQGPLQQLSSQNNRNISRCGVQQGNGLRNNVQMPPIAQGCDATSQYATKAQGYKPSGSPVAVTINGGYKPGASLGNSLMEAYKG